MNGQTSEEAATASGIAALDSAHQGIRLIRQDVESTRYSLPQGYGGGDGDAYGQLLDQWLAHCDTILRNVADMADQLTETQRAHRTTQGDAGAAIQTQQSTGAEIFNTLSPQ